MPRPTSNGCITTFTIDPTPGLNGQLPIDRVVAHNVSGNYNYRVALTATGARRCHSVNSAGSCNSIQAMTSW